MSEERNAKGWMVDRGTWETENNYDNTEDYIGEDLNRRESEVFCQSKNSLYMRNWHRKKLMWDRLIMEEDNDLSEKVYKIVTERLKKEITLVSLQKIDGPTPKESRKRWGGGAWVGAGRIGGRRYGLVEGIEESRDRTKYFSQRCKIREHVRK